MAATCFTPYSEQGKLIFSANDFEIYLSSDSTKVKYLKRSPKRQAHFWSELFIPTTDPVTPESYIRLKPIIEPMKNNIFLQFADVIAYILSHAEKRNNLENSFFYQAKRIKYYIRHTLVTDQNANDLGIEYPPE